MIKDIEDTTKLVKFSAMVVAERIDMEKYVVDFVARIEKDWADVEVYTAEVVKEGWCVLVAEEMCVSVDGAERMSPKDFGLVGHLMTTAIGTRAATSSGRCGMVLEQGCLKLDMLKLTDLKSQLEGWNFQMRNFVMME